MPVTANDLGRMMGEVVVLEVREDGKPPARIEGKLVKVSGTAVAIEGNETVIVWIESIQEAYLHIRQGKLTRRKVRHMLPGQHRQHLLDRHGMPFDMLKILTARNALLLHNKIDHKNLGHVHRPPDEPGEEEDDEDTGD